METRIATTIEQSKRLIELGIDVNTADMYWWHTSLRNYIEAMDNGDFDEEAGDIRAWSLSALLGLMPRIEYLKPMIDLGPKLDAEDVAIYYHSEESPYIVRDNPLDAAFEMVCWLLENKKI